MRYCEGWQDMGIGQDDAAEGRHLSWCATGITGGKDDAVEGQHLSWCAMGIAGGRDHAAEAVVVMVTGVTTHTMLQAGDMADR